MIFPHIVLLAAPKLGTTSQSPQTGRYFIEFGGYKDDYFPTFLNAEQQTTFEADLKTVTSFKSYSRLVRSIPENKPHGMFKMDFGRLVSIFFQNANLGAMAEGAQLKISANFTDGFTMSQYYLLAPGMPGITSNFRAHFLRPESTDPKTSYTVRTFDIVVHLIKSNEWVKVAGWKPVSPQDNFGSGHGG